MQRLCPAGGAVLLFLAVCGLFRLGAQDRGERRPLEARLLSARVGLPPLVWDEALARAARAHAQDLEGRGVLDHTGLGGDRVVDRVRKQGVTEARLGEVLGAGPDEASVVAAWIESPSHNAVILDAGWTHVGAAVSEDGRVWVVVFSTRRVVGLAVTAIPGGVAVTGSLLAKDVVRPVLLVDLVWHEADMWSAADGVFRFEPGPVALESSYVRLGYVAASGALRITNVLLGAPLPVSSSPEPDAPR